MKLLGLQSLNRDFPLQSYHELLSSNLSSLQHLQTVNDPLPLPLDLASGVRPKASSIYKALHLISPPAGQLQHGGIRIPMIRALEQDLLAVEGISQGHVDLDGLTRPPLSWDEVKAGVARANATQGSEAASHRLGRADAVQGVSQVPTSVVVANSFATGGRRVRYDCGGAILLRQSRADAGRCGNGLVTGTAGGLARAIAFEG